MRKNKINKQADRIFIFSDDGNKLQSHPPEFLKMGTLTLGLEKIVEYSDRNFQKRMRYLGLLFVLTVFAACSVPPTLL